MLKIEQCNELFHHFPEMHEKLKIQAKQKRDKHVKKIGACEKRFPVYGIGNFNDSATM